MSEFEIREHLEHCEMIGIDEKGFDRWLAEHEAKVREDYKGRVIDALENAKHNLDTSDPFTDGFLTALDEIAKIIESTKKRATDSFGYL